MLGKGHGGLYKASAKIDRKKRKDNKRERDQINLMDLRFERCQVVGLRKARRRWDVP